MDSFLEEPRRTPKPTPVIQSIQTPTVPEVSLMFQNARKDKSSPVKFGKQMQSYNAWKLRNNTNNNEFDSFLLAAGNKENNTPDKSFLTKKQVRFESPIHKSASAPTFPINKHIEHLLPPSTSSNFKKTIESSPLQVDPNLVFKPTSMETLKRLETLGMVNENRSTTTTQPQQFTNSPQSTTQPQQFINSPKSSVSNNSANTFEKMYCSGFPTPNKELDLSFLEPQKNPCPRQEYFKRLDSPSKKFPTYSDHYYAPKITTPTKNEITPQQNNEIIETEVIENSTALPNNTCEVNSVETENKTETQPEETTNTKTEDKKKPQQVDEGPTVKDLLQIIKMQNDQLQRLQNQVEKLVKLSEIKQQPPQQTTSNQNIVTYKDQQVGTSLNEEIVQQYEQSNIQNNQDNNGKKISVGMMTSFEVSFKPPVATKKKNKSKMRNLTPVADYSRSSAEEALAYQIQQKYEEQRNQDFLKRNQRIKQQPQPPPLPKLQPQLKQQPPQQRDEMNYPNSWQNNTNHVRNNETEYSLGSGQSLEIQEQPESPENSIHIDMQDYDTESEDSDDECSTDTGWTFYKDILGQVNNILENSNRPAYRPNKSNKRNAIVPQETETTLEQIQQNTLKRLQNDGFLQQSEQCAIRPNEISFAVKQILMKYLPDDGLAEAVTKNKTDERYPNTDKRKPTDISVTAVKYMQQCNVVTNAPQYYGRKQKPSKNKQGDPKILDITTLKQQPKLL